ncbi:hypothetical protein RFI_16667, partial [Reticulomyxa filosa]
NAKKKKKEDSPFTEPAQQEKNLMTKSVSLNATKNGESQLEQCSQANGIKVEAETRKIVKKKGNANNEHSNASEEHDGNARKSLTERVKNRAVKPTVETLVRCIGSDRRPKGNTRGGLATPRGCNKFCDLKKENEKGI